MDEVAPGIWLDRTTGRYYDAQGNPTTLTGGGVQGPDAGGSSGGTTSGNGLDPDPTKPGHYPGQTPPWVAAGYPDFASWSASVGAQKAADEAYRQGQIALQNKQLAATTGATGASTVNARIAAQTAANSQAEEARQFNETFGMNKARGDQQQQLAQGQALGSYNGQPTLDAQKFGFDQFKYLSDLAANPRNFMQQDYLLRGFQPPAGSERFGTGGGFTLPGYGAPSRTTQTPGGYTMPSFTQSQTGMVRTGGTPQGPDPGYDNPTEMSHTIYANSPENSERITSAVSAGQLPKSALASVQQFARGGVTPEPIMGVGMRSNPQLFHALSGAPGHKYMLGEQGPEGVVPAQYLPKFLQSRQGQQAMGRPSVQTQAAQRQPNMGRTMDGGAAGVSRYAVGGEIGFDAGTTDPYDPYKNDPSAATYSATPNPGDPIVPQDTPPYDATHLTEGDTSAPSGSFMVLPSGVGFNNPPTNPLPIPGPNTSPFTVAPFTGNVYNASNAPLPIPGVVPSDTTNYSAPHQNEYVAPTQQPFTPTPREPAAPYTPPSSQPVPNADPLGTGPFNLPIHPDTTPVPTQPPVQQPSFQPQGGMTTPAPAPGALTPRDVAAPGTFGQTVGGPSPFVGGDSFNSFSPYLPKFLAGEDTPLADLANQGLIPPWLGRIFAQQQGATQFGTNQPQRFNLPADVPLVSHLAYMQMSPSERAQFSSYLSSYGIDPGDYFDYVTSVSPQGPEAKPSIFGTPFSANTGQV